VTEPDPRSDPALPGGAGAGRTGPDSIGPARAGPEGADPDGGDRADIAPAGRGAARHLALRVVVGLWLLALLLGSLGDLFGIHALVELTDYRALFLR